MSRNRLIFAACLIAFVTALPARAQTIAATPPMGWNSWDAYGLTIDEADYKANTLVLAGMKQYGWTYSVIDEGWYMANPFGGNLEQRKYLWDENGILIPVPARFPSAVKGAGFKPLADWVHAQGLKFGIHIVRGIPKQVVKENLPIADSSFHAVDAADTVATCPWDEGNYGVSDTPAGQAYYDMMMKRYAGWGLDYIKVDCISDHPYRPSEIRQISEAIRKTGRPIVLSLSPGPTGIEHAAEVGKYAQMWRISDDHWDVWQATHKPGDGEFPFGIGDAFDRLAKWQPYAKPGNWPDDDMLPFGSLTPHPGWGEPRQSRYTKDEERTEFTLWSIARSPLIMGANLTKLDDYTRSLMTNKQVLFINQHATDSKPLPQESLPAGFEHVRVWHAIDLGPALPHTPNFYAMFNTDDKPVTLHGTWSQLGLGSGKHTAQDLFDGAKPKESESFDVTLPAHGSTVYLVL